MTAERKRELRAAGYRRAAGKKGRRGSNRVPVLEPTAVARRAAAVTVADAAAEKSARSRRLLVPDDLAKGERTESGIILPKGTDA